MFVSMGKSHENRWMKMGVALWIGNPHRAMAKFHGQAMDSRQVFALESGAGEFKAEAAEAFGSTSTASEALPAPGRHGGGMGMVPGDFNGKLGVDGSFLMKNDENCGLNMNDSKIFMVYMMKYPSEKHLVVDLGI